MLNSQHSKKTKIFTKLWYWSKHFTNSFSFLVATYIGSILIAAIIMFFIENSQSNARTFLDWIYFSIISSLSIGYGDITPQTNMGKIFASMTGVFWLLGLVPLFLTHYISKTIKNDDLFNNKEQIFVLQTLKEIKEISKNIAEENTKLKQEITILSQNFEDFKKIANKT